MSTILINVAGMKDLNKRLQAMAEKTSRLEADIARSINRLDWEVSQKEQIREQINLARRKAGSLSERATGIRNLLAKASNDFALADNRCANQHKELGWSLDAMRKNLLTYLSNTLSSLQNWALKKLDIIKQIGAIFTDKPSEFKLANFKDFNFGVKVNPGAVLPILPPLWLADRIKAMQKNQVVAPAVPPLNGILAYNSEQYNKDVEVMQRRLNELGYLGQDGKPLVVDGKFGPNTLYAVNAFKTRNNLGNKGEYEGKVGVETWGSLFALGSLKAMQTPSQNNHATTSSSESNDHDSANLDSDYTMGSEKERVKYIYGSDAASYEQDRYKSNSEAQAHMKKVSVQIWQIDKKTGEKISATKSITANEKIADVLQKIFKEIHDDPEQFPINWDTAAFNWRGDGSKSLHNQGLAIDINWEENAEMTNAGRITAGKFYKPDESPFSIPADSSVVRAFKKYGWYWGGDWKSKKDYMHFGYLNR